MPALRNLKDSRFGRLLVLKQVGWGSSGGVRWRCLCDCGRTVVVLRSNLCSGCTVSCGCFQKEVAARTCQARTRHGQAANGASTPEYVAWLDMHRRCSDPSKKSWHGRGIKVCRRWFSLALFLQDMGRRPGAEFSLDRKNNNKNYSPANCRWATRKQQARNTTTNRIIAFKGKTLTAIEWSERTGISAETITWRIDRGWPISKAFSILPHTGNRILSRRVRCAD